MDLSVAHIPGCYDYHTQHLVLQNIETLDLNDRDAGSGQGTVCENRPEKRRIDKDFDI